MTKRLIEEDSLQADTDFEILDKHGYPDTRPGRRAPTVVFEDAALRLSRGFSQVPNAVLRDPGLSPAEKVAYALLLSYAWQRDFCFPAQDTLAGDMGCDDRTVRRTVTRLQVARLIRVERRGQGLSNIYHIRRLGDRYKAIVDKP